jgi:hypothetical protein
MDAEHYRRYAKACFHLAGIVTDRDTKVAMMEVARGWLRLAEQNERNSAGAYNAGYETKKAS